MKFYNAIIKAAVIGALASGSGLTLAAQTHTLDLQNTDPAPNGSPINDTVFEGTPDEVTWEVEGSDQGWYTSTASANSEYYFYRPGVDGVHTWIFTQPVDLEFTVNGLNVPFEGIQFTAGTECTFPDDITAEQAARYEWDSATATLKRIVNQNDKADAHLEFSCTLENTQELVLDGTGLGSAGASRGLHSLSFTTRTVAPAVAPVPTMSQWGLMLMAGLLGGIAVLRRKRHM